MSRLKQILKSALQDRSPRFMLGTIALAVVISLLAGAAIGYKIEKSRVKPAKKAATTKKTGTKKTGAKPKIKAAPLLVGAVFATPKGQLIIVKKGSKAPVRVGIGSTTRVALAKADKASSIAVGTKVLFDPSPDSATTAVEVVVLPAKALVGNPVTKVVPGTSMTIKSLSGSTVIKTTGATVETTGPSNRKAITKGTRVLVQYYVVGKRHPAREIVVLPASSKFR